MMGFFKRRKDKLVETSKKMSNYDEVKSVGQYIMGMVQELHPSNAKKKGRVETFQSAYDRLGLDEKTLGLVYKNFFLRLYFCTALFVLGTLATIIFVAQGNRATILTYIGFGAVCLAQMFIASFRMYQMRSRQLFGVGHWLLHKEQWFPKTMVLPPPPRSKTTSLVKR